jgi:outer membrane protein OmpA-like peptidoglycan-associated protein
MNPEDDDQFMDNDGCPEEDNDKDGVKDPDDRCMNDPETQNAYMDEDGCPDDVDKDSDGDRYADSIDRCPYDAEDYDGDKDEDGCPDEGRVVVGKDKIKINDVIYFDTGKDSIQARSDDLLSELAAVIVAHPELKKLRIEGHTDDVGNDALNLKLSDKRARSVMSALVSRGVEASRLDARGFGEMYPLAPNTSEEGRSQNRRVEFVIVDRDE